MVCFVCSYIQKLNADLDKKYKSLFCPVSCLCSLRAKTMSRWHHYTSAGCTMRIPLCYSHQRQKYNSVRRTTSHNRPIFPVWGNHNSVIVHSYTSNERLIYKPSIDIYVVMMGTCYYQLDSRMKIFKNKNKIFMHTPPLDILIAEQHWAFQKFRRFLSTWNYFHVKTHNSYVHVTVVVFLCSPYLEKGSILVVINGNYI